MIAVRRSVAVVLAVATVAGVAATGASARNPSRAVIVDRGLVVSASPVALVLRELDGSTVRIRVGRRTRVFVDGRRSALDAIERGFVAIVRHHGTRPARVVRAFDPTSGAARKHTGRKRHHPHSP